MIWRQFKKCLKVRLKTKTYFGKGMDLLEMYVQCMEKYVQCMYIRVKFLENGMTSL